MSSNNLAVRTVDDFFDHELRDYAKYVVRHRAIPSVIDGFKPSQRKIAHTANTVWKTGSEKPMKVFQLGGLAASQTMFHHGSLDGTIIGMTQEFKNSMSIFQGIGQFGSLRSPEAGAPRYVGVKFNENFRLLYQDFDLVEKQTEEGVEIEPKFFLPILPTVLLNGGSGIAVGFATNILNRHPVHLIDACLTMLNGKSCTTLKPWINGYVGDIDLVPGTQKSWLLQGKFDVKNTSTVEITELPPSWTYEKYEALLDGLVNKGLIHSYDDHSATTPHYVLKFNRLKLAELIQKNKLADLLKMSERETENFTTLDESGDLKIFDTAEGIVDYFVNFRLKYYDIRRNKLIEKINSDLKVIDSRCKFIDAILSETLVISGRKRAEIEADLVKLQIDKHEDSYNYLLNMAIHSLTQEKVKELVASKLKKQKELKQIESTTGKRMYVDDLQDLRAKLIKQGYTP
jgi:DNA topoisomerase-2